MFTFLFVHISIQRFGCKISDINFNPISDIMLNSALLNQISEVPISVSVWYRSSQIWDCTECLPIGRGKEEEIYILLKYDKKNSAIQFFLEYCLLAVGNIVSIILENPMWKGPGENRQDSPQTAVLRTNCFFVLKKSWVFNKKPWIRLIDLRRKKTLNRNFWRNWPCQKIEFFQFPSSNDYQQTTIKKFPTICSFTLESCGVFREHGEAGWYNTLLTPQIVAG